MAAEETGFFAGLTDFGFQRFVTPQIVRVLYVVQLIAIALGFVVFELSAGEKAFVSETTKKAEQHEAIATMLFAPLAALIAVVACRILLELAVVVFNIADDLRAIRKSKTP